MKQKAILTRGLIASGKSTYVLDFIKQNKDYKRVNRDHLRHCLSGYQFDDENEKLVQKIWEAIAKEILSSGYNLIVDEQNLNPGILNKNISFIKNIITDIEIEIKDFPVTLAEAIERDKKRDFVIGEKVIRSTWNKYRDILEKMLENNKPKVKYDPELPNCIICDVDSTLSIRTNRSPFDFSKVLEDELNKSVKDLVEYIRKDKDLFIFSGRDDSCEFNTTQWLMNNGIYGFQIVMRKTGDKRKDSIVKREMYEEHIKDKYNCLYVIDDREQVVNMWRDELGLCCLDVAGNKF